MATGRFAPSPTGELHFGSLLAAVASFCEARSKDASWHLRIDDIDAPRSVPGSASSIKASLLHYGLDWDGDVQLQSEHGERYREALAHLIQQGLVFSCGCSRRSLPANMIYPGNCRAERLKSIDDPVEDRALRLVMPDTLQFDDGVQGLQSINLTASVGDIIIWRRDKLVSYSLACAVDDAIDCTEVVRGADLLPSTAAQIAIMRYLSLTPPTYAHIPVAIDDNGDKLSKHSKARSVNNMDAVPTLHRVWSFLAQQPFAADSIEDFWSKAVPAWQLNRVPALLQKAYRSL